MKLAFDDAFEVEETVWETDSVENIPVPIIYCIPIAVPAESAAEPIPYLLASRLL